MPSFTVSGQEMMLCWAAVSVVLLDGPTATRFIMRYDRRGLFIAIPALARQSGSAHQEAPSAIPVLPVVEPGLAPSRARPGPVLGTLTIRSSTSKPWNAKASSALASPRVILLSRPARVPLLARYDTLLVECFEKLQLR